MKFYKILIISIFLNLSLYANIVDEFPSYRYVFNELDVDENYIYDKNFQDFVNKNKYRYRRLFIQAVNRGQLIVPTMREVMYQKDISPLFIYLSMVESAFRTHAISSSSAGGLWQFVKSTALDENMQVNNIIDERYDPIKSTSRAIDYLYKIHDNLGKWYLTAMAYNCGAGCVQDSIDRAGTIDLSRLINPNANYIRKETRDYIKKILLFAMIGENYLFKAGDNLGEMKYQFDNDRIIPVRVRGGENLRNIASILQMDYSALKRINLHLKKDFVPSNSNIMVNIPASRVQMFRNAYGNPRRAENIYR
ncbi:MAG: lytic transglycosylase domain-containing protein [Epsilonproteobacteria bacterium]|nr:lytic transglycosylase domain-containing protein [Campylobacterota bacterium]